MSQKSLAAAASVGLCSFGGSGFAHADTSGKYECNVLGSNAPEPLGDRAAHGVVSYQFSCVGVDGLLKGAVYSAIHVSEWDGTQGKFLLAGGVHRTGNGLQMQEGTGTIIMQEGKPVGTTSSGIAIFNFGSGTLSALSGKTAKFKSRSAGYGRFVLEFED